MTPYGNSWRRKRAPLRIFGLVSALVVCGGSMSCKEEGPSPDELARLANETPTSLAAKRPRGASAIEWSEMLGQQMAANIARKFRRQEMGGEGVLGECTRLGKRKAVCVIEVFGTVRAEDQGISDEAVERYLCRAKATLTAGRSLRTSVRRGLFGCDREEG